MPAFDPNRQREFAVDVVTQLRAAGFEAYWAGGCVRDQLLGRQPKDYDIATSATPTQVRQVFGRHRTLAIGAAFGVITVLGAKQAGQIEVATFREDDQYSDGRRPDSVRFSTAQADAQRRDFTINGLFYDPQQQCVIDFVDGQRDLERRLVRAIGDPRARLREDRLRMLRAVRIAATYQFEMSAETLDAIREMAPGIGAVSAERIGGEFQRMLLDANRAEAVRLLRLSGLLAVLLPEVDSLYQGVDGGPTWRATLRVLAALPTADVPLAQAALLHRAGDEALAREIGKRWRLSNKQVDRAVWLLDNYRQIDHATSMNWPQLQRLLVTDGIEDLLALHEAVAGSNTPQLAFCRDRLALPPDQLDPLPLVTGDDLIAHGMQPGKSFRVLLERLRDAQLNQTVRTRDEALRLADRLSAEGIG
jgi:tRNA nucleotidyltransferase/poly(A) polymerase